MTQTDKKLIENDQNIDLQIENNRYFSHVFRPENSNKSLFVVVLVTGTPEPDPPPNKKVSEAENGARELKKLAPSP